MESFDATDRHLLALLAADSRASYRTLATAVGLSTPATAARVRRLERAGAIRGYTVRTDRAALGRPVTAFLHVDAPPARGRAARAAAEQADGVLECHRVAGAAALLLKVAVPDLAALDALVERFRLIAPTTATVVLATAFEDGAAAVAPSPATEAGR